MRSALGTVNFTSGQDVQLPSTGTIVSYFVIVNSGFFIFHSFPQARTDCYPVEIQTAPLPDVGLVGNLFDFGV